MTKGRGKQAKISQVGKYQKRPEVDRCFVAWGKGSGGKGEGDTSGKVSSCVAGQGVDTKIKREIKKGKKGNRRKGKD